MPDRRCVTPNPIDLCNGKIYRQTCALVHPLPITGIKREFIKLDTLRGRSRRLPHTAFIPSMVTSFTSYHRLPAPKSKTEIRRMHVAKEEREGEKGMIWVPGESDVAFRNQKLPDQRTNGAAANDRRQCACGAIIALTRASVRPFLVNISCGICGFAERGRSIGGDERADKYHMKTAAERGEPRLPRIRKTMQAACRNDSWWKNYYKLCSGTGRMWQNSLG